MGRIRTRTIACAVAMAAALSLAPLHACLGNSPGGNTHGGRGSALAHVLGTAAGKSRFQSFQYRDAVGPWTAFLGVMHCTGHSAP
jgi:hypothetical protein